MKRENPYNPLTNEPGTTSTAEISVPPATMARPIPTFTMDPTLAENCRRSKALALIELACSCGILIFGIIAISLAATSYPYFYGLCLLGTEIWVAVLCMIAAGLGVGALQHADYTRMCLLISHFVMCIIGAVALGILIGFSSTCIAELSRHANRDYPKVIACLVFEVFILAAAVINAIANILSTAFICRYWCGRTYIPAGTTVFIPTQVGPMQTVALPAGSQVVFLPPNVTVSHVGIQQPVALPMPVATPTAARETGLREEDIA